MSKEQDLVKLASLIADNHGWPKAKTFKSEFKSYFLNDDDKAIFNNVGLEVLDSFPNLPGACAPMSAYLAVCLEKILERDVYVVTGTLTVNNIPVFGDFSGFDGHLLFSNDNFDWNGHAWVMVGQYVADLSIFRTAYSKVSPPRLQNHILSHYGVGRGMQVDRWHQLSKSGLGYHPQYVLDYNQTTALLRYAQLLIESRSPRLNP